MEVKQFVINPSKSESQLLMSFGIFDTNQLESTPGIYMSCGGRLHVYKIDLAAGKPWNKI